MLSYRTEKMNLVRCRRFFGIVFLLALAGCSDENQPVRQGGIVTLEGQPLAGFTVTFMSPENRRPAWGTTDEQGRFELMTFNPGDGAPRGEYKVVVNPPPTPELFEQELPGGPPAPVVKARKKVPSIHENYGSAQTTPLHRVVPAPEGTIRLELNKDGT